MAQMPRLSWSPLPIRLHHKQAVARVLLTNPSERFYVLGIARDVGLRSGLVHRILTRLLEREWVADGWDDTGRRYYIVTPVGRPFLSAMSASDLY